MAALRTALALLLLSLPVHPERSEWVHPERSGWIYPVHPGQGRGERSEGPASPLLAQEQPPALRVTAVEQVLLLTNARVWTANPAQPWAEAVAIRGNKIVAVGSNDEITARFGRAQHRLDLPAGFVMPGINDAHIHFLGGGLALAQVDLTGARSLAEIQRRLIDFARANPAAACPAPDRCGAWITSRGWEYAALPNRLPTRADLDAIFPDRPVALTAYDGHTLWVNSRALQLAGVTAQSKFDGYGEIVLDASGQPTGILKEGAMRLVRAKIPPPTRAQQLDALRRALKLAASLGITSIQNASGSPEDLALYQELLERGALTLRVRLAISLSPRTTQAEIDRIAALAQKYSGPMLAVGAIKIVLDGVIETHTAAMLEPYSDNPATAGQPAYTQEQLNRIVAQADRARIPGKAGLQVYIHAIGDRAVRMALDAFAHTRKVNGTRDSRHRIEHIETVAAEDISRFAALGVMASMEPIHADPGTIDVWSRAVGPERVQRAFAWGDLERAGAQLVFSSDWPACISLDPLRGLHNAVNRQTPDGFPPGGWVPEQRLSLETALAAYTRAGAYASFEEKVKGMIAPGMLADLVVLSADPFRVPPVHGEPVQGEPADLYKLRVLQTIFNGRVIYNATK